MTKYFVIFCVLSAYVRVFLIKGEVQNAIYVLISALFL